MRINVKKNSYNYEWIRKIKNDSLNKTDLFISDNLPEIFSVDTFDVCTRHVRDVCVCSVECSACSSVARVRV